jgi:hypothetical protein
MGFLSRSRQQRLYGTDKFFPTHGAGLHGIHPPPDTTRGKASIFRVRLSRFLASRPHAMRGDRLAARHVAVVNAPQIKG